ncbi:sulfotransferase 1C4 [Nilaparvata lugens]|uniref:sulfotransferase 1C4 n=1 Tax=Nilaparvata lugens TaxID=108931 RepID=UPI00193EC067|nr:sulfotransferase 1C4 [Nilaparvata lugens]XP_039292317.1 sulfotransferase 1C4 [Nilaparvata lugens]XP_039292318.1 sulfotransferase 1C4 [Nilaparvata lugens]
MFPHKIEQVDEQLNMKLMNFFKGERRGFCKVGPEKWLLPMRYMDQAEGYYNMQVRKDDVWIMTFPRSGTTWCQELLWLINNNLDYEKASQTPLDRRFPFLEFGILHSPELHKEIMALNSDTKEIEDQLAFMRQPGYEWAAQMTNPRHFKTHLPFDLLPPSLLDSSKVIYVARNPKDVATSYYYHNRLLKVHEYTGDFETYWDLFEQNLLAFCPYWPHINQAWAKRNHPNLLFLFYEDMVQDLPKNIEKVAEFLGKKLTADQISRLTDHLHIDNFKKNVVLHPKVVINGFYKEGEEDFIRKGKVGGRKEFNSELETKANHWVDEHLASTELKFPVCNSNHR